MIPLSCPEDPSAYRESVESTITMYNHLIITHFLVSLVSPVHVTFYTGYTGYTKKILSLRVGEFRSL